MKIKTFYKLFFIIDNVLSNIYKINGCMGIILFGWQCYIYIHINFVVYVNNTYRFIQSEIIL